MRRARLLVILTAATAMWLAAAAPLATAGPADADSEARAREHFDRAEKLKDDRRYADAATEYLRAHAFLPDPEFFYNAAQMYRLTGDVGEALRYYRKYLAADPDGTVSRAARRYVAELEKQPRPAAGTRTRPVDRAADRPVDRAADRPVDRAAGRPVDRAAERPGGPSGGDSGHHPADPSDGPAGASAGGGLRIAGIVVAVVGVATAAVGVRSGLMARGISDELSAHDGPWTADLLARQSDGKRAERRFILLSSVGAATVVVGGLLYIVGARKRAPERRSIAVVPVVHPAGVGVAVAF